MLHEQFFTAMRYRDLTVMHRASKAEKAPVKTGAVHRYWIFQRFIFLITQFRKRETPKLTIAPIAARTTVFATSWYWMLKKTVNSVPPAVPFLTPRFEKCSWVAMLSFIVNNSLTDNTQS